MSDDERKGTTLGELLVEARLKRPMTPEERERYIKRMDAIADAQTPEQRAAGEAFRKAVKEFLAKLGMPVG